jgi:hypothetical protein
MLAVGQHDAGERGLVLSFHRIADHREGVDPGLAVGRDEIGLLEIARVDLLARDELIDLEGMRAFELDGLELVGIDLDIFAFRQLIAAALLVFLDHLAGFGVHHLLLQPMAGLPVDLMKVGALGRRGRRV